MCSSDLLDYHQRGIMLAVSSKNTHDIAMQVFEQHDDMLIKKEHIQVFQANWEDKASNINAIAGSLDIGLDAIVFLDDNPFEREMVKSEIPEIKIPDLPEDPAHFIEYLKGAVNRITAVC